ncbi:MAG TPA: 4Fe-4S dicluster domain-containing protein [Candidatus Binatia bacterium]|nr:4Fe-4S dicluster domain-containing protein [Candidatus Binatia bacterium]
MSKGILYDATMCIGCRQCEQACATENGLPYDDKIAAEEFTSVHKFTAVMTRGDKFMRRICMNCDDPACASVCPVGAMKKTALGPVTYDKSKCMGCRYCVAACPFRVPRYEYEKAIPGVRKCIMCSKRVAAGKQTACAEICPTGATKFGERDELLEEARKRIHDKPDAYLHHIFGETEVGGTSVLLISSVPVSLFGYPTDLTERALPMYTYQVLSRIPDFIPLFGTMLGGIYWITHRRQDVAEAEAKEKESKGGAR